MKTNSSAVLVPSPAAGTTNATIAEDIRDIKGPVPIPVGWLWLAWALGALVVALAAFFLVRYWLRRRIPTVPQLVIPPHVRARTRLNAALRLLYDPKPFCIEVSDAVRWYLEERFQYRAPERTTDEFLDELRSSPLLSPQQKQSLADFLSRCDLVKFARYEPTEIELRDLHESALRLVDETSWVASASPAPESAEPRTSNADHGLRTTDDGSPTTDHGLRTTDHRPPDTGLRPPTADH